MSTLPSCPFCRLSELVCLYLGKREKIKHITKTTQNFIKSLLIGEQLAGKLTSNLISTHFSSWKCKKIETKRNEMTWNWQHWQLFWKWEKRVKEKCKSYESNPLHLNKISLFVRVRLYVIYEFLWNNIIYLIVFGAFYSLPCRRLCSLSLIDFSLNVKSHPYNSFVFFYSLSFPISLLLLVSYSLL